MEEDFSVHLIKKNSPEFHEYLEQKLRYQWAEEDRNKNATVLKKLHEQTAVFGIGRGPDFSAKELIVQDNAVVIRCSTEESDLAYEHIRYMFYVEKNDTESQMALHKNVLDILRNCFVDNTGMLINDDKFQRSALLIKPSNEIQGTQVEGLNADKTTEKQNQSRKQQPESLSRIGKNAKKGTKVAEIGRNVGKIQEQRGKSEMSAKRAETHNSVRSKSATYRKQAPAGPQDTSIKKADSKMLKEPKLMLATTGNARTGNKEAIGQTQTPKGRDPVSIKADSASKVKNFTLKRDVKKLDQKPKILVREKTVDIKMSKIRNSGGTIKAPQSKDLNWNKNAAAQNKSSGKTIGSAFQESPKLVKVMPANYQAPMGCQERKISQESLKSTQIMPSRIPIPFKYLQSKEQTQTESLLEFESGNPAMSPNQSVKSPRKERLLVDGKAKVATLLSKTNLLMPKAENPMNHRLAIVSKWNYQNPKGEIKTGYNNPKSVVPFKKDDSERHFQTPGTVKVQQENRKISVPLTAGRYHTPRGEIPPRNMYSRTIPASRTYTSKFPETIAKSPSLISQMGAKLSGLLTPKATIPETVTKRPHQTGKTGAKSQESSGIVTVPSQKIKNQRNLGNMGARSTNYDTPRNSIYQTPRNTRYQTPRKSVYNINAKLEKEIPGQTKLNQT